jgi:hypothetical protein
VIDRFAVTPAAAVNAFRGAANWAATHPPVAGDAGSLADLVLASTSIISAAYLARNAIQIRASTMQEALVQYDMVDTVLASELMVARAKCDNCLFMALQQFQIDARNTMLSRAYNSPAVIQYNLQRGISSLVAAHEIYGDAKKFGLIEAHNKPFAPYAMSGQITAPKVA